jgi:hypothetical protein
MDIDQIIYIDAPRVAVAPLCGERGPGLKQRCEGS